MAVLARALLKLKCPALGGRACLELLSHSYQFACRQGFPVRLSRPCRLPRHLWGPGVQITTATFNFVGVETFENRSTGSGDSRY